MVQEHDDNKNNNISSDKNSDAPYSDDEQQQQHPQPEISVVGISSLGYSDSDAEPQTPFTLLPQSTNNNHSRNSFPATTIEPFSSGLVLGEDDVRREQQQHPKCGGCGTDNKLAVTTTEIGNEFGGKSISLLEKIPQRTDWAASTLSLPDLDDVSMNYTFLYMEHYKLDIFWSLLSDSFFILGGISYIVLSGWDYYIFKNSADQPRLNDVNNESYLYVTVDLVAPTIYLINSIIDIHWAEAVRLRLLNMQDMTKVWDSARYQLRGISFTSSSLSSTYDYTDEKGVRFCLGCTWCYRFRKYAAHRRTMMAACSFGVAASLAVVAAVLRNFFVLTLRSEYESIHEISPWVFSVDSILDALSDHVYIISAIFSMTGKRHRPWFTSSDPRTNLYNDSERLEDLGDLLFLIGSLTDATLSDLQLKHLVLLPILSSILWMFDGCLYMRSDTVKAGKLRDEANASIQHDDSHPIKFVI